MINSQRGVSLIITFFTMVILLAIVLFISVILYSQVKLIRNIGDSMVSFFAADSGVEKVLFYDRQVKPTINDGSENGIVAARGLCAMYAEVNALGNQTRCSDGEGEIYCKNPSSLSQYTIEGTMYHNPDGCKPEVCDDCQISFETNFNGRTYKTTAAVYPSADGKFSIFQIESKGAYGGSERQVKVSVSLPEPGAAIQVTNACADPISTSQGTGVEISADVVMSLSGDSISRVLATVHTHNSSGVDVPVSGGSVALVPDGGCPSLADCHWTLTWSTDSATVQSYYVDLKVEDSAGEEGHPLITRDCKDIWSTTFCRENNPEYPSCS